MKQFAFYLLILPLLLHTPLDAQNNFLKRSIYFDSDKYNLDREDSITLSLIADSIQNYASYRLLIRGNTDADADSAYNIKLSQNRCNTVQQFLQLNGAKISNIELDWYGENKPIAENETESGKQQNRRVDIIVYKIIRKPKNPITDSVYVPTDNIEDLFALLKQEPQQYCINPTRDTVLVGEQGTILYFKANSIAVPKGSRIECTAHHDNSASNKFNPDPSLTVRWGDQTWEEMMIGWIDYTIDSQNLRLAQSASK